MPRVFFIVCLSIVMLFTTFIFSGCGGGASSPDEMVGIKSDEQYPLDTGGEALVVADTVEVYGALYGTETVHTLQTGDRVTLIAEFDDKYLDGWRRIAYPDKRTGWVREAGRSQFSLLYYVISESAELSSVPGESGSIIADLPKGTEVEIHDTVVVDGANWSSIRCELGEGWLLQSDIADGLLASCELAYNYGAEGRFKEALAYLKRAENAGAFVDYSNPNGPYALRVPGRIFRVFGGNADYILKENSVGSVAVDKTGKYLAFGRAEGVENYLRIYDLKATDEVFYSPDLKDFHWSPLGQFLAYTDGVKGVYSLRMFWTSRGTVMKSFRLGGDYGWSPDGYLVAFTGLRDAESAEYYLPETDRLPLDNVFTTVELYDPFGMRWSVVAVSTPETKYEFARWKSRSVIYINEYKGQVDKSGIVRYESEPSVKEWPIDRGALVSPRVLSPGYVAKEKNDGGSIDDNDLTAPDKGGAASDSKPTYP